MAAMPTPVPTSPTSEEGREELAAEAGDSQAETLDFDGPLQVGRAEPAAAAKQPMSPTSRELEEALGLPPVWPIMQRKGNTVHKRPAAAHAAEETAADNESASAAEEENAAPPCTQPATAAKEEKKTSRPHLAAWNEFVANFPAEPGMPYRQKMTAAAAQWKTMRNAANSAAEPATKPAAKAGCSKCRYTGCSKCRA